MSFEKYLNNNKSTNGKPHLNRDSVDVDIFELDYRNKEDYFFSKSDVEKIPYFNNYLLINYKLCNDNYYYYNEGTKLWNLEKNTNSLIYRLAHTIKTILEPERQYILKLLYKLRSDLEVKILNHSINTDEKKELDEIQTAIKDFLKFIEKEYKNYQTKKFTTAILPFINHKITDNEFIDKLNKTPHLLPLIDNNINLKTGESIERIKENYFTECLNFYTFNVLESNEPFYNIVNKFYLDISTNNENKKNYLKRLMGACLSGNIDARSFYIFFGNGANGKSAILEIMNNVMGSYFCKAVDSSIFLNRGKKQTGSASPEMVALDYGNRVAILSETSEGDQLNEVLLKNITGGDNIAYRGLYGDTKEFKSASKLILLTNNKPIFKLSTSMIDRLKFIEFKSRFINKLNYEKLIDKTNHYISDPELIEDLKTNYKDSVLKWMIDGAVEYYKTCNLNIPDDAEMMQENANYLKDLDSVLNWMGSECELNQDFKITPKIAYNSYLKYCNDEFITNKLKPSEFKKHMLQTFKIKKISVDYYIGFDIKNDEDNTCEAPDPNGLDFMN